MSFFCGIPVGPEDVNDRGEVMNLHLNPRQGSIHQPGTCTFNAEASQFSAGFQLEITEQKDLQFIRYTKDNMIKIIKFL